MRAQKVAKTYGYINARYIHNVSKKTGKHVTADVKRVAFYNVFGSRKNNPQREQRGNLYDQNGDSVNYGNYMAWAVGKTHHHKYTYRVIVSPKGHMLHDKDFVKVVNEASKEHGVATDFRLLIHRDTDHSHAHVMFHTDKTMSRNQLEVWKKSMRSQIVEIEKIRYRELGMERPDDTPSDNDTAKAKPNQRRRRRRRRNKKQDKGVEL